MLFTVKKILEHCKTENASEQAVAALSKRLAERVFILHGRTIKAISVLDVLNDYAVECITPHGIDKKFFYADGAVWEWRIDGTTNKIENLDAVKGYQKLIDFALFDLDQNTNICWAWDEEELKELLADIA